MRAAPALFAALLGASLAPRALAAQLGYAVEAGGTTVSYNHGPAANGIVVSPSVRLELPRASVFAGSDLGVFDTGGWSAQGSIAASLFTGAPGHLRGELAAVVNGIAYQHTGVMTVLSRGRAHVPLGSGGAWLGGGVGGVGAPDSRSGIVLAEVGGWWRAGTTLFTASFTHTGFRSRDLIIGTVPVPLPSADPAPTTLLFGYRDRRLDDAAATLHLERGVLEVDAAAGARLRSRSDAAEQWGAIGLTIWVSHRAAVIGRAGSDPADLVQGFPRVRFATLGLRLASRDRDRDASAARPADRAVLTLSTTAPTARTIRIRASGAQRVELMGDFTDWQPLPLQRTSGGVWQITLPIHPGTYRLAVRIDEGAWIAPAGLPRQVDEFGDVGVLVLP